MRAGTVLILGLVTVACRRGAPRDNGNPTSDVVAKVGDQALTVAEVTDQLDRQPPAVRAQYRDAERRREFVDNLVRFEVMAAAAKNRGYDRHPEVQRVIKQQIVAQLVEDEIDSKFKPDDVTDADLDGYRREQGLAAGQSDQVGVSEIFSKDRKKAEQAAREAKAASDQVAFRAVVARYSEDETSKAQQGHLGFLGRDTTLYPKPLVEAAFALKEVGAVSAPIQTDRGWHVIRLDEKRSGAVEAEAAAKVDLRRRVYLQIRAKKMEALAADLRKEVKVEIYGERLAKVEVKP